MSDPRAHRHLAAMLRRRLATIAVAVGAGALLGYWLAMALPNSYRSQATIFVATREIDQRLAENGAAPFDLGLRLRSMTPRVLDRERLAALVDELHPYRRQAHELPLEEAIERLRSSVQVLPVEATGVADDSSDRATADTFRVSFAHREPQLAARVAQRLAEAFVEEYIDERVGMSRKGLEAIEAELARQSEQHRSIEAEIAAFKVANAGRLPEELTTNQRMFDQALDELRQARSARDRAHSEQAFWAAEALAEAAPSSPGDELDLAQRLQQVEAQMAELRARGFTDRHPGLIRAARERRELRSQLEAARSAGDEPSRGRHATRDVETQRKRAALELEIRDREVERLERRVELFEQRLAGMPEIAERLGVLNEAERQVARNLTNLADRRLQANLRLEVERRQLGQQFRILEPARPPTEPSSPKRLWILLIGAIAGLGAGIAAAAVAEVRDNSFYAVRDVQRAFQIPVLAAIPEIVLPQDRSARRWRRLRHALALCLLTALGLAGGAVTYVQVNGTPDWLRAALETQRDGRGGRVAPATAGSLASGRSAVVGPIGKS